jgi:hypothetical protein
MNNNAALRVFIGKGLGSFDGGFTVAKQQDLVVMVYNSEGTAKVLYEPKTNYKRDRIYIMIDKSNHFISKAQMRSYI